MPTHSDGESETQPLLQRSENKHFNLVGLSPSAFWVLCCTMWSCAFLAAVDATVIATLVVPIASSFEAASLSSWLGTSYLLAVAACTTIYGRFCDALGRRASMLIALTIFALGNTACAIAPSMNTLIAARALAGMGGAGLATISSTIASDIVPLTHRGIFQGLANVFFGTGVSLGAPIGGFINDTFGWRWAFAGQIPLFILMIVLASRFIIYTPIAHTPAGSPSPSEPKPTTVQALKRIDFPGAILLAAWLSAFLIAITLKTSSTVSPPYKWSNPTILSLLIASLVIFLVFMFVELRVAKQPIMPFELLHRRTPIAVALNNFIISVYTFVLLYCFPVYLQAVKGFGAAKSGRYLVPYGFIGMATSLGSGLIIRKTGKYYWLCFGFGLCGLVTAVFMSRFTESTAEWQLWVFYPFSSFSTAAQSSLTIVALIADVGREHVATATSLSYAARTIGQVAGVALSGALIQSVLQDQLTNLISGPKAEHYITTIRQNPTLIKTLPPVIQLAARQAYEKALHAVFVASIFLAVGYLVTGLGMREVTLERKDEKIAQGDDEQDRGGA